HPAELLSAVPEMAVLPGADRGAGAAMGRERSYLLFRPGNGSDAGEAGRVAQELSTAGAGGRPVLPFGAGDPGRAADGRSGDGAAGDGWVGAVSRRLGDRGLCTGDGCIGAAGLLGAAPGIAGFQSGRTGAPDCEADRSRA